MKNTTVTITSARKTFLNALRGNGTALPTFTTPSGNAYNSMQVAEAFLVACENESATIPSNLVPFVLDGVRVTMKGGC